MTQAIHTPRTTSFTALTPVAPLPEKTLDQQLEEARNYARVVSSQYGVTSVEAATAWDIVEELLATKADIRHEASKSAFEDYCNQHPDALEARMYDV